MFNYRPNLLKLKQLAYQNTGIVYIDKPEEENEAFINELQKITSSTIISAYLFREHGFKDFTAEDWKLMYAQYEYTYGYPTAEQIELFESTLSSFKKHLIPEASSNKVTIEPEDKLTDYIISIFESKIPLRDTQLSMIYSTPIEILKEAYDKAKFVVKETNNIILTILFQELPKEDDWNPFRDFDSVLRFIVSNYSYNRQTKEPTTATKLDKTILSKVDMRIPTAIKKVLLGSIDKIKVNDKSTEQLKKYQEFWKRIFQQLAYTSEARMSKRFKFAFEVKEKLYQKKNLHTDNSEIEYFRKIGDLGTAFSIELGNPGQMVRRLLSYLRYPIGTKYANKGNTLTPGSCKDDVTDLLNDTMFDSALYRTSPKLLLKMLEILKSKEIYTSRTEVKVYSDKHKAQYSSTAPLPPVNKTFADLVVQKINHVLSTILKERNESLGKVYLDLDKARLPIQFSGRLDVTDAMSGGYYPQGSVIDIQNLINEKLKDETLTIDDIVIRAGLAWKGERSTDLDLNTTIIDETTGRLATLYYGSPVMKTTDGEIIGISSGDVLHCNAEVFSAELVDFKYKLAKDSGIGKLFSSFNSYSGSVSKQLEAYFFVEIVTTNNIVERGIKITNYDMSNAIVAIKVNSNENLYGGFVFDLIDNKLIVINKNIKSSQFTNICEKSDKSIDEIIGLNNIYLNDVLASFIEPEQFVTDMSEADTIITTNQYFQQEDGKKVYNLATKAEECQSLYM